MEVDMVNATKTPVRRNTVTTPRVSEEEIAEVQSFVEQVEMRREKQREYRNRPEVQERQRAARQRRAQRAKELAQRAKELGLL
jgi:hypothetical protein